MKIDTKRCNSNLSFSVLLGEDTCISQVPEVQYHSKITECSWRILAYRKSKITKYLWRFKHIGIKYLLKPVPAFFCEELMSIQGTGKPQRCIKRPLCKIASECNSQLQYLIEMSEIQENKWQKWQQIYVGKWRDLNSQLLQERQFPNCLSNLLTTLPSAFKGGP